MGKGARPNDPELTAESEVAPPDPEGTEEEHIGERLREMLRRGLVSGLSGVIQTQESVRRAAADIKLPREVAGYLLSSADRTKDEVLRVVGAEMREWLEKLNLQDELLGLLTSLSFEIKMEVRLIPNEEGFVKPEVKPRVGVKRATTKVKHVKARHSAVRRRVE